MTTTVRTYTAGSFTGTREDATFARSIFATHADVEAAADTAESNAKAHADTLVGELDIPAPDVLGLAAGGSVSVQFDDGYTGQYDALKMMHDEFGMRGTLYMHSGRIGSLTNQITAAQLVELDEQGHEIASHYPSNIDLRTLTEQQLIDGFKECRDDLIAAGVKPPVGFAYPMGYTNDLVRRVGRRFHGYLRAAGAMTGTNLSRMVTGSNRERLEVGSFQADAGLTDPVETARAHRLAARARDQRFHLGLYVHDIDTTDKMDGLKALLRHFRAIGLPVVPIADVASGWNRGMDTIDWAFQSLEDWTVEGTAPANYTYQVVTDRWHTLGSALHVDPSGSSGTESVWFRPDLTRTSGLSVQPGETVRVGYVADVPETLQAGWSGGGIRMRLYTYGMDGGNIDVTAVLTGDTAATDGFEWRSTEWTVPEGVYTVYPQLQYHGVEVGEAWLDSVFLASADQWDAYDS